METLLRERSSVQSVGEGAERFMGAGTAVRDALRAQTQALRDTTRQMGVIHGTFASIDTIYKAIRRKHTRDCLILSCFTSTLLCFLLYWWMSS
jgi:hypothetical protein